MRILVIRHGDPDYVHDSLTEKGWREAELLSRRLVKLPIRDYYVSPLGRAQATAKPTLEKLGRTAETLPWLEEYRGRIIDPTSGKKVICWDFQPAYRTLCDELYDKDCWTENPVLRTGNAEAIFKETAEGVDALLAKYGYHRDGMLYRCPEGGNDVVIALICHFAVGAAILSHVLGVAPPILWHSFFMPPTSVTMLMSEERVQGVAQFRCVQMGDTSHLYAGDEPISLSGMFSEQYNEQGLRP